MKYGEKFSIRKLTVGTASVAIAGLVFLGNPVGADEVTSSQASADTNLVIENQDTSQTDLTTAQEEQAQAIVQAKEIGINVSANAEVVTSDLNQAVVNTQQDTEAIKNATEQQEQNNLDYAQAVKEYEQEVAEKEAKYNEALADYESKTNTDGYLSQAAGQKLVFETGSEQNTVAEVDAAATSVSQEEASAWVENKAILDKDFVLETISDLNYIDEGLYYFLYPNVTTEVSYHNLENAYFDNQRIASVLYTYTVEEAGGEDKVLVKIFNDPTVTIDLVGLNRNTQLGMTVRFLDEEGQQIDVSDGLVSLASLNSHVSFDENTNQNILESNEYVDNFNGNLIQINGSSVVFDQNTGRAYAPYGNESVDFGSKFDRDDWDGTDLAWYGAIVGKVASDGIISFSFGSENRSTQWFAFNSSIQAYQVPTLEVVEEPVLKVEEVSYTPYKVEEKTIIQIPETPKTPNKAEKTNSQNQVKTSVTVKNNNEKANSLPVTGESSSVLAIILGALFFLMGTIGIRLSSKQK